MIDPRDIDPYNDPYDGLNADDVLNFMACRNPSLDDLTNVIGTSSSSRPILEVGSGIDVSDMEVEVPGEWEWLRHQSTVGGDSGAGASNFGGEMNNPPPETIQPQIPFDYSVKQILLCPISPLLFFCSFCQVLRQIVHSNGICVRKLEVHGGFGMITHAVLEDRPIISANSSNTHYEKIDLCKKSLDEIKQYLIDYNVNNIVEEYHPLPESLLAFYDTLCVGMEWENKNGNGNRPRPPPSNPPSSSPPRQPPPPPRPPPPPQPSLPQPLISPENQHSSRTRTENGPSTTSLAAQRQRTGRMTVNDMREYFHLPINEASRRLNLCPTVVKKICRKSGLRRWPYRKIKSYQRKLSMLGPNLNSKDQETMARTIFEVERIQDELTGIFDSVHIN